MTTEYPSFRDPAFLASHVSSVLGFWTRPEALAPEGGMVHCRNDDGSVFDTDTRHLVSSTRLVINFALAIANDVPCPDPLGWRPHLDSSLKFLRERHFISATGGYRWELYLSDEARSDATNRSYGLCFALMAYAASFIAGVSEAAAWVGEAAATLNERFWEEGHGLYADEASQDWATIDPYRGQNANMHAVEAHMLAYRALQEPWHLERARCIAWNMCVRQAALVDAATGCGPLVYEHYSTSWAPDLAFNADKPKDLFKPFGFQPGHLAEWAKLLLQLDVVDAAQGEAPSVGGTGAIVDGAAGGGRSGDACAPSGAEEPGWRLATAARFFDVAVASGWDERGGGGLVYSCRPEPGLPRLDNDKYKWVSCEAIAAAVLLATAPGATAEQRARYLGWYDKLWRHAWEHLVDHEHGSWFRLRGPANEALLDNPKCQPGKVDYHVVTMGIDAANALRGLGVNYSSSFERKV